MKTIALTGSIGMGKSTVAKMLGDLGLPVWSADEAVARAYAKGGAGVLEITKLAPDAVVDGSVDRVLLRQAIQSDATLLARIEGVIHPLVWQDRQTFKSKNSNARGLVFEIPLLYETQSADAYDHVIVVSAAPEIQRTRVLARPTMDQEAFELILSKQVPDFVKRASGDFVIDTGVEIDVTRRRVIEVARQLELI